jgi:hypothetical protein
MRCSELSTYINIAGDLNEGPISGMSLLSAQLGYVTEKNGWGKVSFNVRLLERFNLAGENMIKLELGSVLRVDRLGNHVESKQGGFSATERVRITGG